MNLFQPSQRLFSLSGFAPAQAGAPVSAADPFAPSLAMERDECPAPVRVLVVEDDADVCETIGCLLRHAGYQVDSASDGEAGWNALLQYRFNLLVTDNRMPRLTGVELIERLRASGSNLPAILASGDLPWADADVPSELRPLATLEKPFTGFDLLSKVRAALRFWVSSPSLVPQASS